MAEYLLNILFLFIYLFIKDFSLFTTAAFPPLSQSNPHPSSVQRAIRVPCPVGSPRTTHLYPCLVRWFLFIVFVGVQPQNAVCLDSEKAVCWPHYAIAVLFSTFGFLVYGSMYGIGLNTFTLVSRQHFPFFNRHQVDTET